MARSVRRGTPPGNNCRSPGPAAFAAFAAFLIFSSWLPAPVGAAWSSTTSGPAALFTQSIPAASPPVAVVTGRDISVSWPATLMSGGTPVQGYRLARYPAAGGGSETLISCTGVLVATNCTEEDVPTGTWRYTLTAVNQLWSGPEGPLGSAVTVGPASLAFTSSTVIPAAQLPKVLDGTVANFESDDPLTYRLDSPTGLVLAGTPALAGPDGSATISVTIPSGTDNAPHSVFVVGGSGLAASAAITILDPPVLTSLEMFDVNANGKVDRVVATFSKVLAPYAAGTAPWTITSAPSAASLASVTVSGNAASLTFTEGAGTATTAVGAFRVALAANASGIRDLNGATASFASTAPTDRAAPALTASPAMNDAAANGKVDQVTMTFSEPLAAYTAGTSPWTLAAVPSGGSLASVVTSAATATLTITEGAGAADTSVGAFTLSLAGDGGGIRDAAGNLTAFSGVVPRDAAKPARLSQLAFDDNGNGRFDRVLVTFSEPLAAYTAGVTGWTMTSAPTGMTLASVAVPTGGTTATLTLGEGTIQTTALGSWRVALAANAAGIRDAADNRSSYSATAPTDRAAPVPLTVRMQDITGGDGIVDRVAVLFSETLTTYTAGVAPWSVTNVPSGSSVTAAAVSSATINVTLGSPSGPADTTVGAFTIAMAANAAGARDAAGNVAVSWGPTTPIDGAGPAATAFATTNGGTTVGRIQPADALSLTLSEPLGPAVSLPASTTITLTDPTGTGNDTIAIPGLFSGSRSTGTNLHITTDATSADFAGSTVSLSPDRRTITITVGPACSGTGCAGIGTATAATNTSVLLDPVLKDAAGAAPPTVARNISIRLF